MRMLLKLHFLSVPAAALAMVLLAPIGPSSAAACVIANSPCYPWHIREGEDDTVILEIVPNNADTGAIYGVCICPQTPDITVVFDFGEARRTLGTISGRPDGPVCRDYRIQTSRQSALKIRRASEGKSAIEGCYYAY